MVSNITTIVMAGRGNAPLRPGGVGGARAHRRRDQPVTRRDSRRPARARPGRDGAADRSRSWTSGRGRADGQQCNRKVKFMLRLPAFNFPGITVGRDIMEQSGMTRGLGDGWGVRADR